MASETDVTFETVKTRLDEIVDAVNADGISLDDALDLYEEAVKLGMSASTMLEEGVAEQSAIVGSDDASAAGEDPGIRTSERSAVRGEDEGVGIEQAENTDVGQEAAATAYEGEDGISLQQ